MFGLMISHPAGSKDAPFAGLEALPPIEKWDNDGRLAHHLELEVVIYAQRCAYMCNIAHICATLRIYV